MSEETRKVFGTKLRSHDWYYAYSDDHRYWDRGRRQRMELDAMHKNLRCPYDFGTLSKWAHDMIVEQFAEESPGEWYRQPRKYKCVAPCDRKDLITEQEWSDIQSWFDNP